VKLNACVSDYIPFILPGGDDLNWEGGKPDEKVFVRYSNISVTRRHELEMITGNFQVPCSKTTVLLTKPVLDGGSLLANV
jgi:hypothetical protein